LDAAHDDRNGAPLPEYVDPEPTDPLLDIGQVHFAPFGEADLLFGVEYELGHVLEIRVPEVGPFLGLQRTVDAQTGRTADLEMDVGRVLLDGPMQDLVEVGLFHSFFRLLRMKAGIPRSSSA